MNVRRLLVLLLIPGIPAGMLASCGPPSDAVVVYTAVSLTDVVEEIARAYGHEHGVRVEVRPGSSGQLAVDIEHDAPADVYVSADVQWTDRLAEKGLLVEHATRVLAWNAMVVVCRADAESVPRNHYLLIDVERVAVGDPEYVPAGHYTRQGLSYMGVWDQMLPHLVMCPDVRSALALVERGEAGAGVVYKTDALASDKVQIAFYLPEGTHDPVVYTGALVKASARPEAARAFLEYLGGAKGAAVFRRHGFEGT